MELENANDPFTDLKSYATQGQPVRDPAGWNAGDFDKDGSWLYQFTADELAELERAVRPFDRDSIDLMPLTRQDFDLPTLGPSLLKVRQDLLYGRGFINFRGLDVDHFGKRGAAIAFWAISHFLGDGVCSQNKHGHVLGHVTNLGETKSNPSQRGPYSSETIPYHVDAADIVGLLCIEPAKSGGESSLASSVVIHNEVLRRRPDLLPVLFEPYARDRRDEIPKGMDPWYHLAIFHIHSGYFSASIEPTYIGSAHRFPEIGDMTPQQIEALEFVQELAAELRFEMGFQRGDMQFLNNHVIFHSRQGFEDFENLDQRRHLMRIWLKAMDGRPLPADFYARHGAVEDVDRPGGIVGPDTELSAPISRQ